MNAVLVALIVAFAGVVGPLFLSYLNGRQRRAERAEDYARQDKVAARVEVAAGKAVKVADKAAEAAALLVESNAVAAETAASATADTNRRLDQIHTLVNSNMTAAMQAELDRTQEVLVMLREVMALNEAAGRPPSEDARTRIAVTERKVGELSATLNDRLAQTRIVHEGN